MKKQEKSKNEETGDFEARFDVATRRFSYNSEFHDYYKVNLGFVVGVLDMVFQLADAKRLTDLKNDGFLWVVLEARDRAEQLQNNL